ncbi:3'-5' DNA helicase [Knufia fluminis]|uniref:ATP-dependent DNA helicase n=1 Tax=Knufia fluminis TaxID=191047 RepID=A0AAN8EFP9_9EURO|nr:3'-5' DNA helicase [Knufia fluminis]
MDQYSQNTDNVLVPSSQNHQPSSEPPRKRRRIARLPLESDEDDSSQTTEDSIELPSNDAEDGFIEVDEEILGNQPSKYDAVMHEPAFVESQKNVFVTQIDQPWSSPTRIRGPRWRKKTPTPSPSPERPPPTVQQDTALSNQTTDVLIAEDFDDEEIEALMISQSMESNGVVPETLDDYVQAPQRSQAKNMRQTTLFGRSTTQQDRPVSSTQNRTHNWPLASRSEPPTHHKINEKAMEKWIFPMNIGKMRDYQYNIVHKALYNNILVALPTGLGKTFIAATVMMNWFNWTKDAQIVFMAPTKPLANQQIEACFQIAGIPRSQTTLMTGEIPPHARADEWQTKRVFFMTPQTFHNDLTSGIADPKRIVLVVVDEAHKAKKGYAYSQVNQFLRRFNNSYRILALTATPGSDVESVQEVINNLGIARVEIRTEDSLDIRPFVHERNTELQLFDFSDEITMCIELFSKAVKPLMEKLCSFNAYWSKDPTSITLFGLMQARKKWMASDAGRKANPGIKAMLHKCFTPLMTLAHNLQLLMFHGIGPFYHKMKGFQDEASEGGKYQKMVTEHESFLTMMNRVRVWVNKDDFVGHPKLEYLNFVVLNHFMDAGEGTGRAGGRPPSDTRIMIFAHYRDSAEEICRVLNRHGPMVRAHVFVGQSDTKNSAGMDQKKQTEVIQQFKSGKYNTIVATSIGEEGLDIGEVDLIICYDCSSSPIRMLQRMGRTGRKRAGNIVMLLMRQKEEKAYYSAKDNYQKMQELIESGRDFNYHEDQSPRIVPKTITPIASKEEVVIPFENTQNVSIEPSKSKAKRKKKPAKRFNMPDGVETGFTFLGGKKAKQKTPDKKKPPKKKVFLDSEEAVLPDDSAILLTPGQEIELEERYASVAGEEEQYIQEIQLRNHPDKLHTLDRTSIVGHSRLTISLVRGAGLSRKLERYAQKPLKPLEEESMSRDVEEADLPDSLSGDAPCNDVPFYVPQQDGGIVASQSEALPELDNLFGASSVQPKGPSKKRSRRKIVSDDDEDG